MKCFRNLTLTIILGVAISLRAADFDLAATATNQLAVDLHHQLATGDNNLCVSPYSIQSALAMTYAGADGATRTEMARVLHFPNKDVEVHASFLALRSSLEETAKKTATIVERTKNLGGP